MPPDSPPAAPSPLAIQVAAIVSYADEDWPAEMGPHPLQGELARKVDALLTPVREALSDARTDLAAATRGYQNAEDAKIEAKIHAKLDAALLSLSPQPPEAQ
jgi:hypothetical protein